jgi:hypothetical protein
MSTEEKFFALAVTGFDWGTYEYIDYDFKSDVELDSLHWYNIDTVDRSIGGVVITDSQPEDDVVKASSVLGVVIWPNCKRCPPNVKARDDQAEKAIRTILKKALCV